MTPTIVPHDSWLHTWLAALTLTEIPVAFQVAGGLGMLGACLRRAVYFDQEDWKVWPNLSILFVGPPGCGKDTIINRMEPVIRAIDTTKLVGGKTIDTVKSQLQELGDPAVGYLPLRELSAFAGGKDYQQGIIQELTDILSTGSMVDISTKAGVCHIHNPTLTAFAASTPEWLHKCMPDGAMDGGFFPRFLVIATGSSDRHVPMPKYGAGWTELQAKRRARKEILERVKRAIDTYLPKETEFVPTEEARQEYHNWYANRNRSCSRWAQPYAVRSRDQVLRLAMLMAITRDHVGYIDVDDVRFGIDVMDHVMTRIDDALLPIPKDMQVRRRVLQLIPAHRPLLYEQLLSERYTYREIKEAEEALLFTGRVRQENNTIVS